MLRPYPYLGCGRVQYNIELHGILFALRFDERTGKGLTIFAAHRIGRAALLRRPSPTLAVDDFGDRRKMGCTPLADPRRQGVSL